MANCKLHVLICAVQWYWCRNIDLEAEVLGLSTWPTTPDRHIQYGSSSEWSGVCVILYLIFFVVFFVFCYKSFFPGRCICFGEAAISLSHSLSVSHQHQHTTQHTFDSLSPIAVSTESKKAGDKTIYIYMYIQEFVELYKFESWRRAKSTKYTKFNATAKILLRVVIKRRGANCVLCVRGFWLCECDPWDLNRTQLKSRFRLIDSLDPPDRNTIEKQKNKKTATATSVVVVVCMSLIILNNTTENREESIINYD